VRDPSETFETIADQELAKKKAGKPKRAKAATRGPVDQPRALGRGRGLAGVPGLPRGCPARA
jgi:hypothetical protein